MKNHPFWGLVQRHFAIFPWRNFMVQPPRPNPRPTGGGPRGRRPARRREAHGAWIPDLPGKSTELGSPGGIPGCIIPQIIPQVGRSAYPLYMGYEWIWVLYGCIWNICGRWVGQELAWGPPPRQRDRRGEHDTIGQMFNMGWRWFTFRESTIPMENGSFIGDFPIKTASCFFNPMFCL